MATILSEDGRISALAPCLGCGKTHHFEPPKSDADLFALGCAQVPRPLAWKPRGATEAFFPSVLRRRVTADALIGIRAFVWACPACSKEQGDDFIR